MLVEMDGVRLLTDPVLRGRVAHLRRHAPAPSVDPAEIEGVLLSHLHRDHLDTPSLRKLRAVPRTVGAPGSVAFVRPARGGEVAELRPGESLLLGGVRVTATPAEHRSGRLTRRGVVRGKAVGFLLEGGGARVYFAGDTAPFPAMADLAPVDVALLPVWGWGTRLGPGHLDPETAAAAAAALHARVAVPIHWGTFLTTGLRRRHGDLLTCPGLAFAEAAARLAPETDVQVLEPGQTLALR